MISAGSSNLIAINSNSYVPVSYTHLDVYKRQGGKVAITLAKATRMNSNKKRKNPYRIYKKEKEKEYVNELNTTYND